MSRLTVFCRIGKLWGVEFLKAQSWAPFSSIYTWTMWIFQIFRALWYFMLMTLLGTLQNLFPSTLQINLQNNVGLLASWFCENFLAINHSKSQSIVFNRATLPMPFVIDSNELDYVTQIKLLGVVSDNSLSFNVHIKEVCQKVNTKVSILRRIRKFTPLIDCLRRVIENCKY